MSQKSINYLMRFALHGKHYTYRESLAQLYATNKDAYNNARVILHSITGDAYVA